MTRDRLDPWCWHYAGDVAQEQGQSRLDVYRGLMGLRALLWLFTATREG